MLIPVSSNFYFKVTSALAAPEALSGIKSICASGNHFAAGNQSSTSPITSDHNLFVGTGAVADSFMDWGTSSGGTPVDFTTWQSSSSGDGHSNAGTSDNLIAANLFTDPANNDFNIITDSGFDASPLASDRGAAGTGITDDYNKNPRSSTMPDLGAFKFGVDRAGLAGPDTLAGGWGYYDYLIIDSGAVTATGNVNVITITMASGTTLNMGAHTLTVAGSGNAISNIQDVSGNSNFTFLGGTGVMINPSDNLPLGQTQVIIQYQPSGINCTDGGKPTIRRCYYISSVNSADRNASARFYFDVDNDLNGLTCANLKAYHYDGSGAWSLAGNGDGTAVCEGENSYVVIIGATTFSSFVLADSEESPTAVIIQNFINRGPHFSSLKILLVILILISGWLAFNRVKLGTLYCDKLQKLPRKFWKVF